MLTRDVEEFKAQLNISRSPATARTYGVAMDHLLRYASEAGIETVAEIHPGHFMASIVEGRSPATVALYMTALTQFAEFCHEEETLPNGHYVTFRRRLKRLRGGSVERKLPQVPPEEVFTAVLEAAHRDPGGTIRQNMLRLRDIALLETLRSTGCRVAEVVKLRRRHLAEGRARVVGKGSKTRVVYLDERAQRALDTYLDLRGDTNPESPVFARHDRGAKGLQAMSTSSVRNVVDRLAEEAGVDPSLISPHKFRHRMATRILAGTGHLAAVQDLLGHADPATTRVYAKLADDDLQAVHNSVVL